MMAQEAKMTIIKETLKETRKKLGLLKIVKSFRKKFS